jgi:uncharacterized protein VirK/YbjX
MPLELAYLSLLEFRELITHDSPMHAVWLLPARLTALARRGQGEALHDVGPTSVNKPAEMSRGVPDSRSGYLAWMWRHCEATMEQRGWRGARYRALFLREVLLHSAELKAFRLASADNAVGRAMRLRPRLLDPVARPYLCASWDTPTRLHKIALHYETVEALGRPVHMGPKDEIELLAAPELGEGMRFVLDEATWFQREGPLAFNLFSGKTRLFTLAFALRRENDVLTAHVGAIQGRDIPGVLDTYRDLTRAAHGMRPRDLTIELFRSFCQCLGVERILLVSDSHRQHRAAYFGANAPKVLSDYDAIWTERGALRVDASAFEMAVQQSRRDLEETPSRKRGQYRKRYAMLDEFEARLAENLAALRQASQPEKRQDRRRA